MKINEKTRMILNIAASVTLCAVVGISVLFGMFFSKNHIKSAEISAETEVTEDGTGAVISDGESNGIQLLSTQITPNDDGTGSCTITASIAPANLSDKTVTMSVAWADATSDWATGKTVTDYVTVTQTSTGSLTATLNCLQAFGEQVILTVTSNLDSNYYAESTIDYVKRIEEVRLTASSSSGSFNVGEAFSVSAYAKLGTGTVTGDILYGTTSDPYNINYGIDLSDESTIKSACYILATSYYISFYSCSDYDSYYGACGHALYTTLSTTSASMPTWRSVGITISDISDLLYYSDSESLEAYYTMFEELGYISIYFETSYTYSYNGIEYGSGDISCSVDLITTTNSVSAVSIDDDSYIF